VTPPAAPASPLEGPATLVQILLPLYDPKGEPQPRALFRAVRDQLAERFGGLTTYTRAPAVGLWKEDGFSPPERDDIVIYEVMVAALDRAWWRDYRRSLETLFRQERIVVRSQAIALL
jgi:hypothetical protein